MVSLLMQHNIAGKFEIYPWYYCAYKKVSFHHYRETETETDLVFDSWLY